MQIASLKRLNENKFSVNGSLCFATVAAVLLEAKQLLPLNQPIQLSLKEIGQCDSAGLAFLIALKRYLCHHKGQLSLIDVPEQVLAIAKVSNLEQVLTLMPQGALGSE